MVASEAGQKGIGLSRSTPELHARLDHERIKRVLVNLLSNAIKYSSSGDTITLAYAPAVLTTDGSQKRDAIEFRVSDQGPGIPEDKQSIIFEKYRQTGENAEIERKGSGLGLAICKSIVEAHGGTIGVESKAGHGTSFWFKIPQHAD